MIDAASYGGAGSASVDRTHILFGLIALIMFGVLLIFVQIPGGSPAYSVAGLVIFSGLAMSDFQRVRRSTGLDSAPLIAASIFLDALNVLQFFLRIFSRDDR